MVNLIGAVCPCASPLCNSVTVADKAGDKFRVSEVAFLDSVMTALEGVMGVI